MSLTCIILAETSFIDIPAYLSFASFNILFWTIVTYFPGIVMYVELIVKLASISAFFINFVTARTISSSSIIFPFFIPLHFWLSVYITSI